VLRLRTFGGLRVENDAGDVNHTVRPRPLALLAILAAAGRNGIGREKALGILWADSSPDRARHALSQTLYSLRKELGTEVTISAVDLRLDPQKITADVMEFREAASARDWKTASGLYAGPFLEGFYLGEAPEFERWSDSERSDLALYGLRAIESIAVEHESAGRLHEAAQERRRLTRLDPLSDAYATAYMEVLAAAGDRAGALAHGKSYSEVLKRELDTEPGDDFARLMQRLRTRPTATLDSESRAELRAHSTPAPAIAARSVSAPEEQNPKSFFRSRVAIAALASVAIIAAAIAFRARTADSRTAEKPVLAVGKVRDLVTPDSVRLGGVLGEMLTTSLGRVTPLQVIANSRMLELMPREADTTRTALVDAARRAGATEVLEGELIPLENGRLRLDIRRVNLGDGRIRAGYGVTGDDRMALLDSITSMIAADLKLAAPVQSLADVSTRSPLALRYYEDGLRAFYQFDAYAANRLFRAAVREDSTFAMGVYYAWRSSVAIGDSSQVSLGPRATRLAAKASDHDRLLILAHVGGQQLGLRAIAAADTLAAKYPNDPEALVRSATIVRDLGRSITMLNTAIAIDSAAGISPSAICRLCEALSVLTIRYDWADSVAKVESTLRRWIRLRPEDAAPYSALADYLVGVGRGAEAIEAQHRGDNLGGPRGNPAERKLVWSLRLDDVEGAMKQCTSLLSSADRDDYSPYQWYCTIGLRMSGRLNDAWALVRNGKLPGTNIVRRGLFDDPYHPAILDWESGRPLAAVPKFAAQGYFFGAKASATEGQNARNSTWHMTLAASAALDGGDTLTAKSLVDSIESVGSRSGFDRDPKLHHFIRGRLLALRGDHENAVREYRTAISSPTNGYTRINYEMAKSLMILRRPIEAANVMRSVLHGGLEGSGLYLTRTVVHETMGRAFEQAGRRDSAATHFRVVERAWRQADPMFKTRYEYARARAGN
jgi:DNA-binding SARP family transcriptional activator/TolB-like protein